MLLFTVYFPFFFGVMFYDAPAGVSHVQGFVFIYFLKLLKGNSMANDIWVKAAAEVLSVDSDIICCASAHSK